MRTFLITAAAAVSGLALATPASAQWYPAQQQGYGQNYGRGHWGAELQQMRYEMQQLSAQGRLTRSERRDMSRDIDAAHHMLRNAAYGGINNRQARSLDRQLNRLRNQLHRYADRDRRYRRGW